MYGENNNSKNAFSETDPFWDLELLLPKTEKKVCSSQKYDTQTEDFKSDVFSFDKAPKSEKIPQRQENDIFLPITQAPKNHGKSFDAWLEERKQLERSRGLRGKKTVESYTPNTPLIKSVSISVEERPARTGERFLADAHKFKEHEAEFKGNVPFESYYPQYSQMNAEQISCYIGFRSEVRAGRYPAVDKSYIYLYLYELINLTERAPEERVNAICGLINGYSDSESRLFSDMCNWLCDICLIYKVDLPDGVFGENIFRVIECASVKEFFIKTEQGFDAGIAFLLTCGKYDYRKSRFYSEYKIHYDKHINSAVAYALKEIARSDSRFSGADESICTLTHESYFGALCTSAVRRTISLECVCVTRSESVRSTVTDLTKYAENMLRKRLGIAPRLTVNALTLDRKELIKSYFYEAVKELPIPLKQSKKLKESTPNVSYMPEYEYLYEPKSSEISFEKAKEIERSSWQITEKLVAELEPEAEEFNEKYDISSEKENSTETNESGFLREALKVLLEHGSDEYCKFVRDNGRFPDSVADMINEKMYETVFDIVINVGEIYETIPDYEDEIMGFISNEVI